MWTQKLKHTTPVNYRAQKLLYYLSQVMVNGPQTPLATDIPPANVTPTVPPIPFCKFFWC